MFTPHQIFRSILKAYFTFFNRTNDVAGNMSLPSGPKIIAMNHTPGRDPLDLPFVLKETPHSLLQDGLFAIPVIGWMLKKTEQIPVYRGTEKAKDAKEQACSMLREGKTIGREAIIRERGNLPAKAICDLAGHGNQVLIPIFMHKPTDLWTAPMHWSLKQSGNHNAYRIHCSIPSIVNMRSRQTLFSARESNHDSPF